MKHSSYSSLSALALLLGTFSLVGCGGAVNIDDSAPTTQVTGPPIQGTVYGGHAPIQGAHVYLLQPGTTGYGSAAVSLLGSGTSTSPGGYALASNSSDPNVPATAGYNGDEPQYVTTDANGAFNLTNGYACTVGMPVFIYAYGGNIGTTSTSSSTQVTLTITAASMSLSGGTYTYTFTAANTASTPMAAGNTVNLALTNNPNTAGKHDPSNAGTNWPSLDGNQTVHSANSTSFTVTGTTNLNITNGATGTGTYTYTTSTSTAPTENNNIVQLATLGNCPSSGNFSTSGNGALSYIYLNEVSTVATAYTFQPFTLATNNSAWDIGIPNPTANSGQHAQALVGIEDAADTASQLYNIEGSSTLISTSGDGEGHLANELTANGNGVVPQATLDTLANILAACVDSVPATVGTPTPQCTALFDVATNDGESGQAGDEPVDTGTAAINIARYPAGNGSSANVNTTYASTLFGIPTGTVPYVPELSKAPNDWTIAISYPVSSATYGGVSNPWAQLAESIAIDASGEIWVTGQTKFSIIRLNHLGVIEPSTAQNYLTYIPGYVSVDGNGNAWTGNANCGTPANNTCTTGKPVFEAGSNGVFSTTFGSGYVAAYVDIADSAGDDFFFASNGGNYVMWEYPAGAASGQTGTTGANQYSLSSSGFSTANVAHGAIDSSGDFWLTSETSPYVISKVTNTGTNVWTYTTNVERPEFPAIDGSGNGWIPSQTAAGPIYLINSSASSKQSLTSASTGATLSYPFGAAIDGNGNAWVTNRCGPYNTCSYPSTASSTLVEISGANDQAISPLTNYLPETEYAGATTMTATMLDPLNVAVDPSGNLWITNYVGTAASGSVTEIVGAAAPTVTPLSVAAGKSLLGQKP